LKESIGWVTQVNALWVIYYQVLSDDEVISVGKVAAEAQFRFAFLEFGDETIG
jgi:hypothetical protein